MMDHMRQFLRFIGMVVYFCAWPFWMIYFRGQGRTRILVFQEGKLLVIKNWLGDNRWQLPGGGMHRHESALDGAIRELREETSLDLDPRQLQDVGKGEHHRYGISFDFQVFITKVAVVPSKIRAQRIEVAELAWLPLDQLNESNARHDTLRSLQMAREIGALLQ
jgi:8-oxo-dGTP diphosphatase